MRFALEVAADVLVYLALIVGTTVWILVLAYGLNGGM